jgi:poly-gamma-glutamate synthesis protein (capsule biosynthesis protein)
MTMTELKIAAVGDILVKRSIISDARLPDGSYSFEKLFDKVSPYLKNADLTIGNLETTFPGGGRKHPKWRQSIGPLFKCPDQMAQALKEVGFDVLVTANNHCVDYGTAGLLRTIRVLDRAGIDHTGTFSSLQESRKLLIKKVKGVKIGILSYTEMTNKLPVAASRPWLVNKMRAGKIIRDIRALKKSGTDLIIVCLHFGREYQFVPIKSQKRLVSLLFKHGANIILGSHPHVLQPLSARGKKRFVIYSLGNFVSTKLRNNPHTQSSVILTLNIKKDKTGKTAITGMDYIPTHVSRRKSGGRGITEVIPIRDILEGRVSGLETRQHMLMKRMMADTKKILKGEKIK